MDHTLLLALTGLLGLSFLFRAARWHAWRHHMRWAHAGGPGCEGPGCGGRGWGGRGWGGRGWGGRGWGGRDGNGTDEGHGPRRGRPGRSGARVSEEAFARAAGEVLKRRLRVGPDQEDIVDHALRDAQGALKDLHGVLRDSREGLAGAFAGEAVDEAAIAAAFSRQDEALKRARQDLASALKQVHAVLDEGQRTRLAELLGKSEGWFQG